MTGLRFQEAMRMLRSAQTRVQRQKDLIAALERSGRAKAVLAAREMLDVCERSLQQSQTIVDTYESTYGVREQSFTVHAVKLNGEARTLPPREIASALQAAMELADTGFVQIILKDPVSGEEMHFSPPPHKLI